MTLDPEEIKKRLATDSTISNWARIMLLALVEEIELLRRESACPCCQNDINLEGKPCQECHGKGLAIIAYETSRYREKRQSEELVALRREKEAAEQRVKELERYERACKNHLCQYDLADWLVCAGGHTLNADDLHGAVYCYVCDEDEGGTHPHGKRVALEARVSELEGVCERLAEAGSRIDVWTDDPWIDSAIHAQSVILWDRVMNARFEWRAALSEYEQFTKNRENPAREQTTPDKP